MARLSQPTHRRSRQSLDTVRPRLHRSPTGLLAGCSAAAASPVNSCEPLLPSSTAVGGSDARRPCRRRTAEARPGRGPPRVLQNISVLREPRWLGSIHAIGFLPMERWDHGHLSRQQAELAETWLGAPSLIADLSWGQVDTKVLRVSTGDGTVIVKAAGPDNHHIAREITAHESYTSPLVTRGRAGRLLHSSRQLNLLVLEYLEGDLVDGTAEELTESAHSQAGELLNLLHGRQSRADDQYEFRMTAKSLAWLDRKHRIDPEVEREALRRTGHLPTGRPAAPLSTWPDLISP